MIDETIKEACLINAAVPNSQPSQHHQQEAPVELKRICQLKTAYVILLVLSPMGIIPNKLDEI
jgi:hypothetical protein